MKRKLLFCLLLFIGFITYAAPLNNVPTHITQPDGTVIDCFVSGDEYYHSLHDAAGYTFIIESDGYYYYTQKKGDKLVASSYKVGQIDPRTVGLEPWLTISDQEYAYRKEQLNPPSKKRGALGLHAGTFNNLVLFIKFKDSPAFQEPLTHYEEVFNSAKGLKGYYEEVSYNKLHIQSIFPTKKNDTGFVAYVDTCLRSYYQPYNTTTNPNGYQSYERTAREQGLLKRALQWFANNYQLPLTTNLDVNKDGEIDFMTFIVQGENGAWADLIWPHKSSLTSDLKIQNAVVNSYIMGLEKSNSTTFCHETFHHLSAPDLYHASTKGNGESEFDIMAAGQNHMHAYMKWRYSNHTWIEDIPLISKSGLYTLKPLTQSNNNSYRIASPNSSTESVYVEYRKNMPGTFENGFDMLGLVAYRVDNSLSGNFNGPPDELYLYRPKSKCMTTKVDSAYANRAPLSRNRTFDELGDTSKATTTFLQKCGAAGININSVSYIGDSITFIVEIQDKQAPQNFRVDTLLPGKVALSWKSSTNVILVCSPTPVFGVPEAGKSYAPGSTLTGGGNIVYVGNKTNFTHKPSIGKPMYYMIWAQTPNGYSQAAMEYVEVPSFINSYPWTEDFETSTRQQIPYGFKQTHLGGNYEGWNVVDGTNQYMNFVNKKPLKGKLFLALIDTFRYGWPPQNYKFGDTVLLQLPGLDVSSLRQAMLQFNCLVKSYSYFKEETELELLYRYSSQSDWKKMENINFKNLPIGWNTMKCLLPSDHDTIYLAFKGASSMNTSGLGIDDISIFDPTTKPSVKLIPVTDYSKDKALLKLNIKTQFLATSVKILLSTDPKKLIEKKTVPLAFNADSLQQVLIDGLSPSTTYYYQVIATNALGSANSSIASFITNQTVATELPFTEEFLTQASLNNWSLINFLSDSLAFVRGELNSNLRPQYVSNGTNGVLQRYSSKLMTDDKVDITAITKTFNFSGYKSVLLSFEQFSFSGNISLLSTSDNFHWDTVKVWNKVNNHLLETIDLSKTLAGKEEVKLRWSYTNFYSSTFVLDGIRIYGEKTNSQVKNILVDNKPLALFRADSLMYLYSLKAGSAMPTVSVEGVQSIITYPSAIPGMVNIRIVDQNNIDLQQYSLYLCYLPTYEFQSKDVKACTDSWLTVGIYSEGIYEQVQWFKNGLPVSDIVGGNSFDVPQAKVDDSGLYSAQVFDYCGSTPTSTVKATVFAPPLNPSITRDKNTLIASTGTYFQWYKDGTAITGEQFNQTLVKATGSYMVQTSYIEKGCSTLTAPFVISTLATNAVYSSVNTLSDLKVNGKSLAGFRSDSLTYYYLSDTLSLSAVVSATTVDTKAVYSVTYPANMKGVCTIAVRAENGTVRNYSINFCSLPYILSKIKDLDVCEGHSISTSYYCNNFTEYTIYFNNTPDYTSPFTSNYLSTIHKSGNMILSYTGVYRLELKSACGITRSNDYTVTIHPTPAKPVIKKDGNTLYVDDTYSTYSWQNYAKSDIVSTSYALQVTTPANYLVLAYDKYSCSNYSFWNVTSLLVDKTPFMSRLTDIKYKGTSLSQFDPKVLQYNLTVSRASVADFVAVTNDKNAVIKTTFNTKKDTLSIFVRGIDSTSLTYKVALTYLYIASDNNYLSMISVNKNPIKNFKKDSITYRYRIDTLSSKPVITAQVEDSLAIYTVTYPTITNGTCTITVTAENGNKRDYSITFCSAPLAPTISNMETCAGTILSNTATSDNFTSYSFYFKGSLDYSGTYQSNTINLIYRTGAIDVLATGTYQLGLKNSCGENRSNSYNLTVHPLPVQPVIKIEGNTLYVNQSYSQFQWQKQGDNTVLSTIYALHVASPATYLLTVQNEFACTTVTTQNMAKIVVDTVPYLSQLSDIKFKGVSILGFDAKTTRYTLAISPALVGDFEAKPTSADAVIEKTMNATNTQLTISVKGVDGTVLLYKIDITKPLVASTNNYLASIVVNGRSISNFKKDSLSYRFQADTITTVQITATTEDAKASYTTSIPKTLPGQCTITVKAENTNTRVYQIDLCYAPHLAQTIDNLVACKGETKSKQLAIPATCTKINRYVNNTLTNTLTNATNTVELWYMGIADTLQNGSYQLSLENACGKWFSNKYSIVVNKLPNQPTITKKNNTLITDAKAETYTWYLANTIASSTNTVTVNKLGDYTLKITDVNGCSQTSNPFNVATLAANEYNNIPGLTLYPNPATNVLYCQLGSTMESSGIIEIHNCLGQIAIKKEVNQLEKIQTIDISSLVPGIYWVKWNKFIERVIVK